MGVSCTYTTPNPTFLKNRIFSALAAVIKQHPILSAIPVDQDSEFPRFARLPTIDLGKLVKRVFRKWRYKGNGRDQELDELLEAQLNIPFVIDDGPLPFWRLFLLFSPLSPNDFVVTIVYHHGIADGMSGAIFHNSFLSALRSDHRPLLSPIVLSPGMPLLPNLELVHDLDDNPYQEQESDQTALWSGKAMQAPIVGHFRSTVIPKSIADRFIRACRTRDTTVTSAVQVILAATLFHVIPTQYTLLRSATPVNLRPRLPTPINEFSMGVFIDTVSEIYHREDIPSFSWSEVRGARQNMSAYLSAGGKYLDAAGLKRIQGLNKAMLESLGKERGNSFEVSNLGFIGSKMQGGVQNGWRSGRMVFSRSASVSAPALGCALITGADGCLVLGYSWQDGIVEDRLVKEVIESVESEIIRLSQ